MIALEQQLIGALLNAPDKAGAAGHVSPACFEDAYLGDIKAAIDRADGHFDVGTIIADMENHGDYERMGGRAYIARLYVDMPMYVIDVGPAADKVVEAWQRRQAILLFDQQARQVALGRDLHAVLAEYRPRFDALGPAETRFRPLAIADMVLPATPWRIRGLMPRHGIGFCAGASGAGKSFLTLDMALRLAAGHRLVLGRKATGCGVLYIATEDATGCMARVHAWRRHAKAPADMPFELLAAGIDLNDGHCVAQLSQAVRDVAARFQARGTELGLVVVDTLSRALPGCDENSGQEMSRAVRALESLAEASGAFVLAVAHHGKGGTDRGIRGWSGVNAASDMTLTVTRDEDDVDVRIVTLSKIKNAGDGGDIRFRLKPAGTGLNDADGEEVVSCVCAYEAAPEPADLDADAVVAAVRDVLHRFESYPAAGGPGAAARAVDLDAAQNQAIKAGLARGATAAAAERRFINAANRLSAAGRVRLDLPNKLISLM